MASPHQIVSTTNVESKSMSAGATEATVLMLASHAQVTCTNAQFNM